jgi:hypothetical protein
LGGTTTREREKGKKRKKREEEAPHRYECLMLRQEREAERKKGHCRDAESQEHGRYLNDS